MSRFAVVVLAMLIIGMLGCAYRMSETQRNVMDSWFGTHISEYVQTHGAYNQITSDEQGGRIYIWIQHFNKPVLPPSPAPLTGGFEVGMLHGLADVLNARNRQRNATPLIIQLYTRSDGSIYSWHVSGLDNSVELPVRHRR